MDSEILYWTRFNFAVSSFCHEVTHQDNSIGELVHAIGGDELEWCDSSIFTYLTKQYIQATHILDETNKRNQSLQVQLHNEIKHSQCLQNKLKYFKRSNEDSEWRLQEQVAQLHSLLQRGEKEQIQEIVPQASKPVAIKEKTFLKVENKMNSKNIIHPNVKEDLENLELSEFNSTCI